jgi:hypothetical protein
LGKRTVVAVAAAKHHTLVATSAGMVAYISSAEYGFWQLLFASQLDRLHHNSGSRLCHDLLIC